MVEEENQEKKQFEHFSSTQTSWRGNEEEGNLCTSVI